MRRRTLLAGSALAAISGGARAQTLTKMTIATGVDPAFSQFYVAKEAGLFEIRERCSFRHPLVRSAVYRSAAGQERRLAHAALADATDPELDPDRRAWHRAQATAAPDENVAAELERTAARAKARGGHVAAAAFMERAAQLTPDASVRAERTLASWRVEVRNRCGRKPALGGGASDRCRDRMLA